MKCASCGAEQPAGNRFCEDCGVRLGTVPESAGAGGCPNCGAQGAAIDAHGFCTRCGCERKAADHLEVGVSERLAGVSDRGKARHRNEDYLALASAADGDVLVVCDGVSSSQNAAEAAKAAATAACEALSAALNSASGAPWDGKAAMSEAMDAAQSAVRGVCFNPADRTDPPETTMVAAVRYGSELTIGWLGDSRAYLVLGEEAVPLTRDHSWMNECVSAGAQDVPQAAAHPQARAITRTLGRPEPGHDSDEPSLVVVDLAARNADWLLLCTDGFWECFQDARQLAGLVARHAIGGDTLRLSRELVAHAARESGRDNITVVMLNLRQQ